MNSDKQSKMKHTIMSKGTGQCGSILGVYKSKIILKYWARAASKLGV